MKLIIYIIASLLFFSNLSKAESENIEPVNNTDSPTLIGYLKGSIVVKLGESSNRIDLQKSRDGIALFGINSLDVISNKFGITEIKPQFPGAKPIFFEGR
ncbi:MAG: hypothetical protein GY865_14230, partial [candidate division Zixibacteria bacterium]|nr:hypothetical protein [candidate division Zixibacteria bacterium]